jgi:hypothetical protein
MRRLLQNSIKRDMAMAFVLAWAAGAGWWFGIALPTRKRYEEFYSNYDAKAIASSMKASWEE